MGAKGHVHLQSETIEICGIHNEDLENMTLMAHTEDKEGK